MRTQHPQALRVKSVAVTHFRGIRQGSLTFTSDDGAPVSTFILGDNGSGKSSFLEAINYSLSGQMPRLVQVGQSLRMHPRNYLATDKDEMETQVLMSDGRTISSKSKSWTQVPEFGLVSLLIKRDHLLAFGRSNDDQRGKLLQTIVRARSIDKTELSERETALTAKKAAARAEFEKVSAELTQMLSIRPHEAPPMSPSDVQIFLTAKRITSKQISRGRAKRYGPKIRELSALGARLQEAADQHEKSVNQLAEAAVERRRGPIIDVLTAASDRLNSAFHELAHGDTQNIVSRIELTQTPGRGSVALSVVLPDGVVVPAATVLSEASLDLASLLALISLVQDGANRGQSRVLILDDVFQSVDNTLRDRLAGYLFRELAGWQLIIAFHERAWFERFSDIAKAEQFPHVRRRIWRDIGGEVRVTKGYSSSYDHLVDSLANGDYKLVPTIASRVIEELFENISISLKCKVVRTESDKYTIGDVLPGIKERCSRYSAISSSLESLDKHLYMRNLVGAHSTSWAENFSDNDAREFGLAVRRSYELLVCSKCGVSLQLRKGGAECKCGFLQAQ